MQFETIGNKLNYIRQIGSGRLKGYTRGNTELPGGLQGASDLFKRLAGRDPLGDFDRVALSDGREVVFRVSRKSSIPKIEIVDPSQQFLEKISFPIIDSGEISDD